MKLPCSTLVGGCRNLSRTKAAHARARVGIPSEWEPATFSRRLSLRLRPLHALPPVTKLSHCARIDCDTPSRYQRSEGVA